MYSKGCGRKFSYPNSKHYLKIYLERLKKTKQHLGDDAWSLNQNSMQGPSESKAGILSKLSRGSLVFGVVRKVVD